MSKGDYQCPYCGYGMYDDESDYHNASGAETDCNKCEKTFRISGHVTADYSTKGDCALIGALPHKFKAACAFTPGYFECVTCHSEFYDFHLPGGKYPKLKAEEFVFIEKEPENETA